MSIESAVTDNYLASLYRARSEEGARVTNASLARELGVAPTTVGAKLQLLRREGLVRTCGVSKPHRHWPDGIFVPHRLGDEYVAMDCVPQNACSLTVRGIGLEGGKAPTVLGFVAGADVIQ